MNFEVSDIVENEDGGATIVISGDKKGLEEFQSVMFSHFLTNAIKLIKESDVKILDDLNDNYSIKLSFDDYDRLENKLIQISGLLNVLMDAYDGADFGDLSASLWVISDMLNEVKKIIKIDE